MQDRKHRLSLITLVRPRRQLMIRSWLIRRLNRSKYVAAQKEIIATEKNKAMDEVRAQVISLSMIAAGKIVEQKLDSEEDKQLASKIVDSIMK